VTSQNPPSNPPRATVIDVARAAGVSPSTVSRILNSTAGVAPAKREAVDAAIRELDFRPNASARSLKTGTTMTVGVVVQDLESLFFTRVLSGVEERLSEAGYVPVTVRGGWNAAREAERIRLLMDRRIDGLVVVCGHIADEVLAEFARRRPVAVVGREMVAPRLASKWLDQVQAGYLATRHLLQLGHQRIAHIAGSPGQLDAVHRQEGWRRALREAGIEPDPRLVAQGDFTETGGLIATQRLLDAAPPFTAIFAANDQTAYGASMALYRRGIRVPDNLSLVGVDDLPASSFVTPALTTVRQPLYEIGAHAASALLHLLGQCDAPPDVPPLELVIRETTRRA
jgi:LacI family transcriptional regulator